MWDSTSLGYRMLLQVTCLAAFAAGAVAQTASNAGNEVPARTLPVPDTVSPQMQKLIAAITADPKRYLNIKVSLF